MPRSSICVPPAFPGLPSAAPRARAVKLHFTLDHDCLRTKTFVGTSANALHKIWTALIACCCIKYLQLRARFGWSLSNLVALLRLNLFVYRDLWTWLDQPFTPPPLWAEPVQQQLPLG